MIFTHRYDRLKIIELHPVFSFSRLPPMKWLLLFGVFISSTLAFSQGISLFNIDPSGFPTIKAKFYAYDKHLTAHQLASQNRSLQYWS